MARYHIKTDQLNINTAKCTVCGSCVSACKHGVLKIPGIQRIASDRHVEVVEPKKCTGCLACVKACPQGAIHKR